MDEQETSWWRWATGGCSALASAAYNDSALRQRAFIVVASVLVCAYAAAVMGYVLVTPEIGVRCAFTRVVNHVYPGFVLPVPKGQLALKEGDTLVKVGPKEVNSWGQLLREVVKLPSRPPSSSGGDLTEQDLVEGKGERDNITIADVEGERLVRVAFERETA